MTENERLQKAVRVLLERHLLDWKQEGQSDGWYELKQEMPGYRDLQPLVDEILQLILGVKSDGIQQGFKEFTKLNQLKGGE